MEEDPRTRTDPEEDHTMEDGCEAAKERGLERNQPCPHLDLSLSMEAVNLYCSSHPAGGTVSQQPRQTEAAADMERIVFALGSASPISAVPGTMAWALS